MTTPQLILNWDLNVWTVLIGFFSCVFSIAGIIWLFGRYFEKFNGLLILPKQLNDLKELFTSEINMLKANDIRHETRHEALVQRIDRMEDRRRSNG